jgi:membrane-associated phospholipid phosphatase
VSAPGTRYLAALLLAAIALPARPDGGPSSLHVNWALDGAVTGGALLLWGASELGKGALSPPTCRWCGTPSLDADLRKVVVWSTTKTAAELSDVLMFSVPAGVVAYDVLAGHAAGGDMTNAGADALVITEAVAISGVLTQAAKYATARQRPYAFYGTGANGRDDHSSFWSGHTSAVFSAAAAGGMVAQLRGCPGWPWLFGVGFTAAAATGYFRMAADKHWLTDVVASAAS